jgi:hypothetical protein
LKEVTGQLRRWTSLPVARQALLERLTGLDPAFGVITLQKMASMQTYLLEIGFWIAVVLGRSGARVDGVRLFSVLSYSSNRPPEIGARMALGAAAKHAGLMRAPASLPAAAWPRRWQLS